MEARQFLRIYVTTQNGKQFIAPIERSSQNLGEQIADLYAESISGGEDVQVSHQISVRNVRHNGFVVYIPKHMTIGCILDDGAHITCDVHDLRKGRNQNDQQSKRLQKQIKHEKKILQCDVSPPRQLIVQLNQKNDQLKHQKLGEEFKDYRSISHIIMNLDQEQRANLKETNNAILLEQVLPNIDKKVQSSPKSINQIQQEYNQVPLIIVNPNKQPKESEIAPNQAKQPLLKVTNQKEKSVDLKQKSLQDSQQKEQGLQEAEFLENEAKLREKELKEKELKENELKEKELKEKELKEKEQKDLRDKKEKERQRQAQQLKEDTAKEVARLHKEQQEAIRLVAEEAALKQQGLSLNKKTKAVKKTEKLINQESSSEDDKRANQKVLKSRQQPAQLPKKKETKKQSMDLDQNLFEGL